MSNLLMLKNNQATIKSTDLVEIINNFRYQEGERKKLKHDDFLKKIRKELQILDKLEITVNGKISESFYVNARGKKYPCYELNRDGMLQMLSGESAFVRYKTVQYINYLEQQLEKPKETIPTDYLSALKALVASEEEKAKQALLLEEAKPKIEAYDQFMNTDGTYTVSNASKALGLKPRKEVFPYLRKKGLVTTKNLATTIGIDRGWFVNKMVGEFLALRITPKGFQYLLDNMDKIIGVV